MSIIKSVFNYFKALPIVIKSASTYRNYKAQLEKSEHKYRNIFELCPLPMWIYNTETLRFLQVNAAAIIEYGYSEAEFLQMTLKDIRPIEDENIFSGVLGDIKLKKEFSRGVYRHRKKDGEIIFVDVQGNSIDHNDPTLRLVVVKNITERMKHIYTIEQQNVKLNEISWIQSHNCSGSPRAVNGFSY